MSWLKGLALIGISLGMVLPICASDPLETGAKGTFEITPRLEPIRPLPGEDLFLRITIQAVTPFVQGPTAPGLVDLAGETRSSFANRFRVKLLEQENPGRIPEAALGAPGTTWVFVYQLIPIRQVDGSFPPEIPEFGLITTRADIPWSRLARQFTWLGPFPLRYQEATGGKGDPISSKSVMPPWWLGLGVCFLGLFGIILWESLLWRSGVAQWCQLVREGDVQRVRVLVYQWLVSRSVVLPAEPIASQVRIQMIQAGYGDRFAVQAEMVWSNLTDLCFRKDPATDSEQKGSAQNAQSLIQSWKWVPWKRRII